MDGSVGEFFWVVLGVMDGGAVSASGMFHKPLETYMGTLTITLLFLNI